MKQQIRQFDDIHVAGLDNETEDGVSAEIMQLDHGIKLTVVKGEVAEDCKFPLPLRRHALTMVFVAAGTVSLAAKVPQGRVVLGAGDAGLLSAGFAFGPTILSATEELSAVFVELPRAYMTKVFAEL
jgi:hypothetical protein